MSGGSNFLESIGEIKTEHTLNAINQMEQTHSAICKDAQIQFSDVKR